jgi:hypothetical protein
LLDEQEDLDDEARIENAYQEFGPAVVDGDVEDMGFTPPFSIQMMYA